MAKIKVHHFRVWDQTRGEHIVPKRKSPVARIERIGGEIIPNTAQEVDEADLDQEGRYDPRRA